MGSCNSGGKRGAGALNDATHINGKNIFTDELTYEEYNAVYDREMSKIKAEMAEEERQLDDVQSKVDAWIADKNSSHNLDSVKRLDGDVENLYLEKDTKKNLIDDYIKEYNSNGFSLGDDIVISVLYKDGTYKSSYDGKKLSTTGIDSIIVEGDWGTTFCGKVKVTHDTPEAKWNIKNVGGGKVNVGGTTKHLPKYKGFQAVWHVDFE